MSERPLHILLVEDEPAHAALIREAFAGGEALERPVRLTLAASLCDARACLSEALPDLVIADLRLPDGTGTDLLELAAVEPGCPVVFMTSRGAEKDAVAAIKAGALDYVVKTAETLEGMPRIAARALREWGHIARRRRAEHRLERFRFMLDQAHDALFVIDPDTGRFVDCNETALRRLGYTREELTRMCIRDVEVGHQVFGYEEGLAAFLRHYGHRPATIPIEGTHRRKDGSTFPVEVSVAVEDFVGRSYLVVVARDVSSRKAAEAQIRIWENNFEKVFKVSPHTMMITSINSGKILEVSDHFFEVTAYRREDILGTPVQALKLWVDPEDRRRFTRLVLEHGSVRDFEACFRMRSGEVRVCLISGALVELGGELCVFSITRDVTEQKRLEAQILEANEALERQVEARAARIQELERQRAEVEKLAATGRMAAGIAHEINNPLASIMSSFELVARAVPEGHPRQPYVRRVEQDLDRVARIIRHMYNLYQPTTEAPQELRCDEVLREVDVLLAPYCRQRGVTLRLCDRRAPDALWLPPTSLHQVVWNLVHNAVTASPEGGEVAVTAVTETAWLRLTVSDQGPGIPADIQPRIFEPFFSTGTDGSMGLGLSISQSMVRAMGGAITFRTAPGEGTTFDVRLPRQMPVAP